MRRSSDPCAAAALSGDNAREWPLARSLTACLGAAIADEQLSVSYDDVARTGRWMVTAKIRFGAIEQRLMLNGLRFKLKCELWGRDSGILGSEAKLFTYTPVMYFPDPDPTPYENVRFDVVLGEGVLDEDGSMLGYVDEVYGRLTLTNQYTTAGITEDTQVVLHGF